MIASTTTSSSSSSPSAIGGGAVVERIHRVEMLRAELDRSLKMAAAAASLNSATAKRSPLCILFRAADSVHIQFSGSTHSSPIDLFTKPRSAPVTAPSSSSVAAAGAAVSRFTVSPTPNAVPPAAFGSGSPKFCTVDNNNGAATTTTTTLPWSLSSLNVFTTAMTTGSGNNRQNEGDTDSGRAASVGDDAAVASAAIAAAELLAPLPPSASVMEKDEEKGSNDKTADFVVPPPPSLPIDGGGEEGAATVPPFKPSPGAGGAAALSPASSVDSGVASPGAAGDYLLLGSSSSASFRCPKELDNTVAKLGRNDNNSNHRHTSAAANSPCWATVPRTTRRRIFNFGTTGDDSGNNDRNGSPLIDALTLSSATTQQSVANNITGASTGAEKTGHSLASTAAPMLSLTLQRPPLKKKYGQTNITTEQQSLSQLCQPKTDVSFPSSTNGYNQNDNSSNSFITMDFAANASSASPVQPKSADSSRAQMAIVNAKLVITNTTNNSANGSEKEGEQIGNATRRTPLSVVQTMDGAVRRPLSDGIRNHKDKSADPNGTHGGNSNNNENNGGAESDTSMDNNHSTAFCGTGLPPRSATVPPLRSILKKPRASQQQQQPPTDTTLLMMTKMALANAGTQQQLRQQQQPNMFTMVPSPLPRNHLRRMPTRLILERSVSDSVLDDAAIPDDQFAALQNSAAAAFNASILRRLSSSSTVSPGGLGSFDEQLEEDNIKAEQQQNGNNGNGGGSTSSSSSSCPSSCSSETIDTDGSGQSTAPAPIVKKRVSFSECVHARYFRSNSSILGQKKKNEKKSRKRTNRRCNSDIVHPSSADDMTSQQQQQTPQSHNHHNDCDESCPWIIWKH